jgi:hypothetical protein
MKSRVTCSVRLAFAFAFVQLQSSALAIAQTTDIPYRVTCSTCRVVSDALFVLGTPNDSVLIDPGTNLSRDSRGRFFAVGFGGRSILIFGADGRFERAFGRAGRGPGEFSSTVYGARINADTLFVFTTDSRVAVFSPQLSYMRTVTLYVLAPSLPTVVGSDSRIVVSAFVRKPESIAYHFHEVAEDGKVLRSFGPRDSVVAPYPGMDGAAGLSPRKRFELSALDERAWTTALDTRFTLNGWGKSPQPDSLNFSRVPWLAANPVPPTRAERKADALAAALAIGEGRPQPPFRTPPRPSANVIRADQLGRLWVLVTVPFNSGQRPAGPLASCRGATSDLYPGWRACVLLDVIDHRSRTLLTSTLLEEPRLFVPGTDLMYALRADANGIIMIPVFRVRFER